MKELFESPKHPYTKGLLNAIPKITRERNPLETIEGMVPNPTERIEGCSFSPRCPYATDQCRKAEPPMAELSDGCLVRCWQYAKENEEA